LHALKRYNTQKVCTSGLLPAYSECATSAFAKDMPYLNHHVLQILVELRPLQLRLA